MLRYKLRTLLIVLALGPPVLAWLWYVKANYDVSLLPDGSIVIVEKVPAVESIPPYE